MIKPDHAQWPLLESWRVPDGHPVLAGHFPEYPVIPGALLLDWIACLAESFVGKAPIHIRATRFHAPARADMLLRAHGRVQDGVFQFAVVADGETLLCTGSLSTAARGAAP
ncbi:hypothetical protein [Ottowia testudinis]|uniref:ApeI dehydratase-like domain-containing protein n=1 Tax=Ottowia testudinis TaxID=2816950 RepID=A0A975CF51_9BURK|nr:hypothetical protein [Ottowia testudinis]QTD43687.1 hypothetical protein J1M35_10975 [Ottowia testudinis]